MSIAKFAAKVIGDKRRWREYKARVRQLPEQYREAVEAFERYLMYFGSDDADSAASLFEDLVDLFEQSAASGTPIRDIVGTNPIEFIDALRQNYPQGNWISREQQRLTGAINRIAAGTP